MEEITHRFKILSQITRAQHFAWRQAVTELFPTADAREVVLRMWEITGAQTAASYLKRLDPTAPLAPQVARSIAWSSRCMGEDAVAWEDGAREDGDQAFIEHADCPWVHWHRRCDLLSEDRPGCDMWFSAMVETINAELDSALRFETLQTLPEGAPTCLRRLWEERA